MMVRIKKRSICIDTVASLYSGVDFQDIRNENVFDTHIRIYDPLDIYSLICTVGLIRIEDLGQADTQAHIKPVPAVLITWFEIELAGTSPRSIAVTGDIRTGIKKNPVRLEGTAYARICRKDMFTD